MLAIFLIASFLAQSVLGVPHPSVKIINGQEAVPHAFPYAIFVKVSNNNGAWCLKGIYVGATVILGAHDKGVSEPTQVFNEITSVKVHPQYDPSTNEYEVALAELVSPVVYTDAIQPAQLPKDTSGNSYVGQTGTICGWGGITSQENNEYSTVLQTLEDVVIPLDKCKKQVSNAFDYSICLSGAGGKGLGQFDNGAPLVIDGVVVGVAGMHTVGAPQVFTRVDSVLDWIKANSDLQ